MNPQLKGSLCGMLSAACYGTSPSLALLLYAQGFDAANSLFYRYFAALIMMLPLLALKKEKISLPLRDLKTLAPPGICFALSTLTYFLSFNFMNAGISATILFLYPVFTAVIMVLAYHEKITVSIVLALVLSFAGVTLLHGAEAGGLSLIGSALAVISALTYALYIVGINRSHLVISNEKLTCWLILFSVGITAIYMLVSPDAAFMLPNKPQHYLYVILLGLVPTIISLELLNVSVLHIGSTTTAILGALEPVTAVALSVIIFNETVSFNLAAGICLIIGGVLLVLGGQRFKAKRVHTYIRLFNFVIRKNLRRRWRWKS